MLQITHSPADPRAPTPSAKRVRHFGDENAIYLRLVCVPFHTRGNVQFLGEGEGECKNPKFKHFFLQIYMRIWFFIILANTVWRIYSKNLFSHNTLVKMSSCVITNLTAGKGAALPEKLNFRIISTPSQRSNAKNNVTSGFAEPWSLHQFRLLRGRSSYENDA